jgi:hypothetical protein
MTIFASIQRVMERREAEKYIKAKAEFELQFRLTRAVERIAENSTAMRAAGHEGEVK